MPAEDQVQIAANLSDPTSFPDVGTVGRIYEVGINGVGYMLADAPENRQEMQRRRTTGALDPPRLATSETPFSEAIERYSFVASSDWSGGAGQRRLGREGSDPVRFWDSDGVHPFEPHQLTLLHATEEHLDEAYSGLRAVVASDKLFALTAAGTLKYLDDPGDVTPTTITLPGTPTVTSLASDGMRWYAAAGTDGIFRDTTGTPVSAWSSVQAELAAWAGERLCVAYAGGTSTTPNVFSTLNEDGNEEVAGGRKIFDEEWTIESIAGGGGHVWIAVSHGDAGAIYRWHVSDDVPVLAWPLPEGQVPTSVFWYQGRVLVRARHTKATGDTQAYIYQSVLSGEGDLDPFRLAVLDTDGFDDGPGGFGADGRFVFFSWGAMDASSNDGIGAIDLSTGGYARWFKGPNGSGVRSIVAWRQRVFFCVVGDGVYAEDPDTYVTEGYVETSITDLRSGLDKVWDEVRLHCRPLPTGGSVEWEYSIDFGDSFTGLTAATMDQAGQTTVEAELAERAAAMTRRVRLKHTDGSATPVLLMDQVQAHQLGKADTVLQLPIACADELTGLNGKGLPENAPGAGSLRAGRLEALAQTRVKVQDVDWPVTGAAEIFEVQQVDRYSFSVRDRKLGRNATQEVAVLVLRKGTQ